MSSGEEGQDASDHVYGIVLERPVLPGARLRLPPRPGKRFGRRLGAFRSWIVEVIRKGKKMGDCGNSDQRKRVLYKTHHMHASSVSY